MLRYVNEGTFAQRRVIVNGIEFLFQKKFAGALVFVPVLEHRYTVIQAYSATRQARRAGRAFFLQRESVPGEACAVSHWPNFIFCWV